MTNWKYIIFGIALTVIASHFYNLILYDNFTTGSVNIALLVGLIGFGAIIGGIIKE